MFDFFKASELMARIGKPPNDARTPSEVIYRENKLRVLHYLPTTKSVVPVPVLIVSSLINKYYILDLMPDKSYVAYLNAQGFSVYIVDWGTPDEADRRLGLEDYIDGYMERIVSEVLRHAQAQQLSLIGYCMGGTMTLMYAARHPLEVRNIVLLATPVDFENDSLLNIWSRKEYFDVDKFVDTYGNVPVEVLQNTFVMLKPTKNLTRYADLLKHAEDEEFVKTFLAFDYWVNDAVPVAGETFRQFVKATYQGNLLARGSMRLGGQRINLKKIKCPVFNIVAEHDNIVPPESSACLTNLIASRETELLKVKGGHHGISIGPNALRLVWPKTADWLKSHSVLKPAQKSVRKSAQKNSKKLQAVVSAKRARTAEENH
jgi:polyhydroxyalkanoate synthase